MATLYTHRFAYTLCPVTVSTGLYIVPLGFRAVVRDIIATADSTPGLWTQGLIFSEASHGDWLRMSGFMIWPNMEWSGRAIFEEAEEITCFPIDGDWTVMMSGFLLSLP